MDGVPQTTFIPRKPVSDAAQLRPRGGNMFLTFGILILILAVVISAGLFAYQQFYLQKNLSTAEATLQANLKQFDPSLISQMTTLNNQFGAASDILSQHSALSIFFNFLAANTIASVRFSDFSYTTANGALAVSLDGQAATFAALDAQESQFLQPGSTLQAATISNVAVTKTGNVTFTVTGTVPMKALSYKDEISSAATANTASLTTPSTPLLQ